MTPSNGHVLVRRDGPSTYFIVDADTNAELAGPFESEGYAFGFAHSFACKGGGRVLDGVHHDVGVLASKLREAQWRVDRLAESCRRLASELGDAGTRTNGWRGTTSPPSP